MCGIVGMAGRITFKEEKAFKDLLYINALRGKHSVGLAAVDQAGLVHVRKRAIPVDDFLEAAPVQEIFRKQLRCLIGHNRFATVGKINSLNAHPFEMEHVVGVHNGSLKNMSLLKDHNMFDVDSEAIYHNINELGVAETAMRLDGAWALVWWDRRDNTLHMWRNEERPLYYVYSKDRKLIFWASELNMLYLALARHGIEYTTAYEVTPHKEYKFAIPLFKDEAINDIKIAPVQAYVRPVPPVYQGAANFQKKALALVTTTGSKNTVKLEAGTKVRFYIDQVNGNRAGAYMMGSPVNIDTTDIEIVNITSGQRIVFNRGINEEWEGVINGRKYRNDKPQNYIIQANSVQLHSPQMGNAIMTTLAEDEPEETITIENQELTRREFMQEYGHCTCGLCGMDLEFENGHHVQRSELRPTDYACASCMDAQDTIAGMYSNRNH